VTRLVPAAQAAALGLAVAASVALCLLPFVSASTSSSTTSADGEVRSTESTATLLEDQGAGVLLVLAVPVLLTLLPLLVRPVAVAAVCTAALGLLVVVTGFSIGLLYLPALVAAVVAVGLRMDRPRRLPVMDWPERH
jgi:hypothetical protein